MKIEPNKFVAVSYTLHVGDDGEERELMNQAKKDNPLVFVTGMGMMPPAFEENINDLSIGDKFAFTLTPDQAYGECDDDKEVELPKSMFEVDGKFDTDIVFEGNIVPMLDTDGNRWEGMVLGVTDELVTIDFNHPLAGETLHFSGEVLDVHEATAEEIAALAGSCGCGCGDCGSDCGCDSDDCSSGCGCGCAE